MQCVKAESRPLAEFIKVSMLLMVLSPMDFSRGAIEEPPRSGPDSRERLAEHAVGALTSRQCLTVIRLRRDATPEQKKIRAEDVQASSDELQQIATSINRRVHDGCLTKAEQVLANSVHKFMQMNARLRNIQVHGIGCANCQTELAN
jgi:hypothetical protein